MKITHFFLAALAMASVCVNTVSCSQSEAKNAEENELPAIEVTTLSEALTSWDGAMLPKYPQCDTTKLTFLLYKIPAHSVMDRHFHPIMSFGYLIEGELTVVSDAGDEMTFKPGEVIVETVNTWHHGENRGDEDVVLVVGYNGAPGIPLAVKEGEGSPGDY